MQALTRTTAQAIEDRKTHNAILKTLKNSDAKFESRAASDEERRRARTGMRLHRATKRIARGRGQRKAKSRKNRPAGAAKPSAKTTNDATESRHIPCNGCGRRKTKCTCFTKGRGLQITQSRKSKLVQPIPARVKKSRIQYWQDTGDMPAYMEQIGWKTTMRYSWLFPIAFTWRHFSNEHLWSALQKTGVVLENQPPNFTLMEKVLRSFQAANVSYHGGIFYSGSALKSYRWSNVGKWTKCKANQDFISREILALRIVWHVAASMKETYDSLHRNPTRQCWKACTEQFLSELHQHTKAGL